MITSPKLTSCLHMCVCVILVRSILCRSSLTDCYSVCMCVCVCMRVETGRKVISFSLPLSLSVCVCVCVYLCMYVSVFACMCVCKNRKKSCVCVCVCVRMCVSFYKYMSLSVYIYIYIYISVNQYLYQPADLKQNTDRQTDYHREKVLTRTRSSSFFFYARKYNYILVLCYPVKYTSLQ